MGDLGTILAALWRAALLAAGFVLAFIVLLAPVSPGTGGWLMPDLIFCLAAVWVLRRPEGAPLPALLAIGLAADLLLGRPVGLGALSFLLAMEFLRTQATTLSGSGFLLEWLAITLVALGAAILLRLGLWISLAEGPRTMLLLHQALLTALAYPLVAAFARSVLRVRPAGRRYYGEAGS
ncbi:MAG: rod shape-determining protein MreD [Rubricella sp.]